MVKSEVIEIDGSISDLTPTEYYGRLNALPVGRKEEVQQRQNWALAYVWGFQDAAGGSADGMEPLRFSDAYTYRALLFAEEKVCSMPAVPDAFKSWRETGRVHP